ncbi:MAG: hypothetical protein DBX90_11165 [Lentisphaerae bacterium]|nr:MAG: hypothetical protein DBX90_11165 [Lentisphaerota bacterium]
MNEVTRARLKLFGAILLVILLAHVLIITLIMKHHPAPAEETPVGTEQAATAAAVQTAVPASSATAPVPVKEEKKPGFWSRLFGGGQKKQAAVAPAPPPPPPVYRYKKPTGNPNFEKPFNFATAVHGNLPASQVVGSAGATSGIMVDLTTRNVLWEKNSTAKVPIASMVKMMTLLVTFEELEKNPAISLESPVQITKTALAVPRTGVVWLDPRETFPLSDLLKAVTIKSANDAAVQVAEFIGGDVDSFVNRMNLRAQTLGMTNSHFVSPCGLPDKKKGNSLSCARDMVVLAEQLLEYPDVMRWSTTKQDFIREGEKKTMLTTTNKLVNPRWPGVDGLKTGFINASGYCLTFSVLRDGRRIVGCVTGFKSARDRDRFSRKLIDWGYARAAALK